jgi:hypothetical protein
MLPADNGSRYPVSRLRIDELNAQITLLDRFGPGGIGAALARRLRAIAFASRNAINGVARHMMQCARDCEIA